MFQGIGNPVTAHNAHFHIIPNDENSSFPAEMFASSGKTMPH